MALVLEKADDILYNFEQENKGFHKLFKSILIDLDMCNASQEVITKLFDLERHYNKDKYELTVIAYNEGTHQK